MIERSDPTARLAGKTNTACWDSSVLALRNPPSQVSDERAIMKSQGRHAVALFLVGVLGTTGMLGCARKGDTATAEMRDAAGVFDTTGATFDSARTLPDTSRGLEMDGAAAADAVATLNPTEGSTVRGTVTFREDAGKVRVVAHITGLTPGEHGFHLHENGDCSLKDAMSAGGHFNPTGMPHGGPDTPRRHVGDLGNVTANQEGVAHYERVDGVLSLTGPNSILGKSVIVHAGPDDFVTQPSGNSGARLACGVIRTQMTPSGAPADSMGAGLQGGSSRSDTSRGK